MNKKSKIGDRPLPLVHTVHIICILAYYSQYIHTYCTVHTYTHTYIHTYSTCTVQYTYNIWLYGILNSIILLVPLYDNQSKSVHPLGVYFFWTSDKTDCGDHVSFQKKCFDCFFMLFINKYFGGFVFVVRGRARGTA